MISTDQSLIYVMKLFQGLYLFVTIGGLVICLRNRWLSPWMWLIAGALGGMVAINGAHFSYNTLLSILGVGNTSVAIGFGAVMMLASLLNWIAFIVGLSLMWKDVRERFQRLRELHEERAQDAGANR